MPITREHLIWAAAIMVEKSYGEEADSFVSEMIDDLMDKDDIAGVEMWLKIGVALDQLSSSDPEVPLGRH